MWLLPQNGVLFVGVFMASAILFGVYIRTPDCWKLLCEQGFGYCLVNVIVFSWGE